MAYLNTKWIFKFNDNKTNIQFVVREENNFYYIDLFLFEKPNIGNKITSKLISLPNNVYRTGNIIIENGLCFDEYSVKSLNLMLKFRNNKISPVSYVSINCVNENNQKDRNFTFNMDSIKEYGSFVS
uniref:Uncharacterized protein n=1 Tax=viral metagenome TaxID=1070528 RepID=A0A6C0L1J4_9ZZZZ|tara:strand:+ start:11514 stop:11894 length:381 start_codon:yes stop_codon:yes gene_type:complete